MLSMGADVRISGLVKRYGSAVTAVDNVSFDVAQGEFLSVLGPSGSGKTSVLMCLAGFEVPSAGRLAIGGRDVTDLPPNRREIGVIFQRYALFPHMSVRENVRFPLKMRGMPRAESDRIIDETLATVRLAALAERMPAQLSGGQQQRVALARAIAFRPPLLLMDEPFSALDKKLRDEMQVEVKELQRKLGLTIIFVTHDQEEALTMSDRIAVMNHGRLEQIGTPDRVYGDPATRFVAGFVGEAHALPGVVRAVEGRRITLALDDGGQAAAVAPEGSALAAGARAEIVLRPEHVALNPAVGEGEGLAARLIAKSFAGATVGLTFETRRGARVFTRRPVQESAALPIGGEVALGVQPGQARCFPLAGGVA